MIRILLLSFLAFSSASLFANSPFGVLDLESVKFKPKKVWFYHQPYMPEYTTPRPGETRITPNHPDGTADFEHWQYGVEVEYDLNLLRYNNHRILFWDNRVYTYGTNVQVRHVGWDFDLGVELIPDKLKTYWHHHSEHVMERDVGTHKRYPLLDELVVEVTFYQRGK